MAKTLSYMPILSILRPWQVAIRMPSSPPPFIRYSIYNILVGRLETKLDCASAKRPSSRYHNRILTLN